LNSLKLHVDDVIIFLLNNENFSAEDLGFTQAAGVWETAGFVNAASDLVGSIEGLLREGMREEGGFAER